ncbi:hypothetical protein AB0O22_38290 [Streptomyces sp. NPDC091204]|uniref:hypothetical protein n=1 Tax=Streptomyces sp. NPDC091204 TaxID=3155299 RepID=UPI003435FDDA
MHWNPVEQNRPQERDTAPPAPAPAPAVRSKWPRRVLALGTTMLSSLAGKLLADLLQDFMGP